MAKKTEEYFVPRYKATRTCAVVCDLCQKEKSYPRDVSDWSTNSYDVSEVIVSMNLGTAYPECYWGEITSFHICPECFENKLIPWFHVNGNAPTVEEYDG